MAALVGSDCHTVGDVLCDVAAALRIPVRKVRYRIWWARTLMDRPAIRWLGPIELGQRNGY
jgi:hypothetical protein